jgi:hypothetical protein
MKRRLLLVSLLAGFPALLCAQELKLVNCRTLEAAGNFVGPDEVIVKDMVCQKGKPDAPANAAPQAPKPVIGIVISGDDSSNVVEAAKAATKRVEAAKEAAAEAAAKENVTQGASPAAPAAADSVAPVAKSEASALAIESKSETPDSKAPAAKTAAAPAPEPAEPARPAPEPVVEPAAASPAASEPAASPGAESHGAHPEPSTAAAPLPAAEVPSAGKPVENPAVEASAPAAVAPAAVIAVSGAASAEAPKAAAPDGGSGFYDANAGTTVVTNPRPEDAPEAATEAASAAPVEPAPRPLTRNEAEAQAALLAPDPNEPRERVVATGAFVQPEEVAPDSAAMEHKTTFLPGDTEGFEEGQRAECTKNITLAGLKGEKLVLGTPGWATKWIEKNQKRMPQMCFSDTPMKTAKNYLIVFYTARTEANTGAMPADASQTPQGVPPGGVGAFTLSYGSTWHYAQERTVGVTVLTRDEADEPQSELGKVWYATAYTEEGVPVSERWQEKTKKTVKIDDKDTKSKKARETRAELEHLSDELLDQMVGDIAKL